MHCLYWDKDYLEKNKALRDITRTYNLEIGFDVKFAEGSAGFSRASKTYDNFETSLKKLGCSKHSGNLIRSDNEEYYIEFTTNFKKLTKHLHKKCSDQLHIVNVTWDVCIWVLDAEKVEDIRDFFAPLLIIGIKKNRVSAKKKSDETIAIGVNGLTEILFPKYSEKDHPGFIRPTSSNVVPRLVLIKGAPGTGKTILSIKMMLEILAHNCDVTYYSLNDSSDSIQAQCESFRFTNKNNALVKTSDYPNLKIIDKDEIGAIVEGESIFKKMIDWFKSNKSKRNTTRVLFVDSLNISDYVQTTSAKDVRNFLRSLKLRENNTYTDTLSFILMEDHKENFDMATRQIIADCEFIADIVIDMGEDDKFGYQTHYLKINKKHFGPQIYGKHLLKIMPPENPFSNIEEERGVVIYPSVHKYLSRSLEDTYSRNNFVHTGISHLDSILKTTDNESFVNGKSIPTNACLVIQGAEGGYHLALGINILIGGMWRINEIVTKNRIEYDVTTGDDVLLITLNEENNIEMFDEALAIRTDQYTKISDFGISLDNGRWIDWRYHNATVPKDAFTKILQVCDEPIYLKNENVAYRFFGENNLLKEGVEYFIKHNSGLNEQEAEKYRIKSSADVWRILRMDPEKTPDYDKHGDIISPSSEESGFIDCYGNVTQRYKNLPEKNKLDLFNNDEFEQKIKQILSRTLQGDRHYNVDSESKPKCNCCDYFEGNLNANKKVIFNKWCAYILDKEGNRKGSCRKMVVASFRPGCITSEQFIFCIERLLEKGKFSRIMFNSTAHLGMRFPLLAKDDLFIPALIDLFKSKNCVSIFIDPVGEGAHKLLAHTLANMADYLIRLRDIERKSDTDNISRIIDLPEEYKAVDIPHIPINGQYNEVVKYLATNRELCRWSEIIVENIRGSNYSRIPHAITARKYSIKVEISPDKLRKETGVEDSEPIWETLKKEFFISSDSKSPEKYYVNSENVAVASLENTLEKKVGTNNVGAVANFLRRYRPRKINEMFVVNIKKFERTARRYEPKTEIRVKLKTECSFRLIDISRGGMNIEVLPPINIPDLNVIPIVISDQNDKVCVKFRCRLPVRWIRQSPNTNAYNMGFSFNKISSKDQNEIDKFLAEYCNIEIGTGYSQGG